MALSDCPGDDVLHDCTHTLPALQAQTLEWLDDAVERLFANFGGPDIDVHPPRPLTLEEAHRLLRFREKSLTHHIVSPEFLRQYAGVVRTSEKESS